MKFRIWNKEQREWVKELDSVSIHELIKTDNEEKPIRATGITGYSIDENYKYSILRYTEKNDWDCREIYEGDIIFCKDLYSNEFIGEIKSRDDYFIIKDKLSEETMILTFTEIEKVYVVGNIYETDNILKGIKFIWRATNE